jgi:hypothetical protein
MHYKFSILFISLSLCAGRNPIDAELEELRPHYVDESTQQTLTEIFAPEPVQDAFNGYWQAMCEEAETCTHNLDEKKGVESELRNSLYKQRFEVLSINQKRLIVAHSKLAGKILKLPGCRCTTLEPTFRRVLYAAQLQKCCDEHRLAARVVEKKVGRSGIADAPEQGLVVVAERVNRVFHWSALKECHKLAFAAFVKYCCALDITVGNVSLSQENNIIEVYDTEEHIWYGSEQERKKYGAKLLWQDFGIDPKTVLDDQ